MTNENPPCEESTKVSSQSPSSYPIAPPVTCDVVDEAFPTLYTAEFVKGFTNVLIKSRNAKLKLQFPEEFRSEDVAILEEFFDERKSMDLTGFNDTNGLSFYQLHEIVRLNEDALREVFGGCCGGLQLYEGLLEEIRDCFADLTANKDYDMGKKVFLTFHRSKQQRHAPVYSVMKDTVLKRIVVSFRSSELFHPTRDWLHNLNNTLGELRTPVQIRDKMKRKLKDRLLVHRGFYKYLFQNDRMEEGRQRYDSVIADIETAIHGEEGYSVVVSGHSLGGALATMFSMKLAGAGDCAKNIPRPITCITWAAPFSGTAGYRTAIEYLEQAGLLRSLRINTSGDVIPVFQFASLFGCRLMKHTGVNLMLTLSGHRIEHSSRSNILTALRNSLVIKPICCAWCYHDLKMHKGRLGREASKLKGVTLDDIYKDNKYVSQKFIDGSTY